MQTTDDSLLQTLADFGKVNVGEGTLFLPTETVKRIEKVAGRKGCSVVDILVENGLLTAEDVAKVKAARAEVEFLDLDGITIPDEVIGIMGAELAHRLRIIPIKTTTGLVTVAMTDPFDLDLIDSLTHMLDGNLVQVVVVTESALDAAILKHYPLRNLTVREA